MLTHQQGYEVCPFCNKEFQFYIVAPPLERQRALITFEKAYITHYDLCKKNKPLVAVHKIKQNRIKEYLNDNTNG